MTKYAKCDSCGGIYPEGMIKEIKYSYSVFPPASKDKLVTTQVCGMLCLNCGQQRATTISEGKTTTPDQKRKKSYGRSN